MTSESRGISGTDGSKDPTISEKTRTRRGIVNMLKVKKARTKGIMQKVNWNEIGQPIDKESMTLAHFIGAYARRNIPIVCDDWRKKEWQNVKQTLWDEIKETFQGVEDEHKGKIIRRAGELHRQFRTRLRSLAKDRNGKYSVVPPSLYVNLSSVAPHWKEFVENSSKEEFMEISEKNKDKAKGMEARYKKACVGYARIREKLK
ncbi:uncharacterized protein LOC141707824 isoform X1 [Apium graveolens]|uniref:uncharacterized protein LOC141707824 isoform X1 n=2 Tax=Apium graveolens TaxID=4045 RepID=UPI003D7A4BED